MSDKENIILFLGNADNDGVLAKLKATGTLYKRKMLESKKQNWATIIKYFDNYNVTAVAAKLTNYTYSFLCDATYKEVGGNLFGKISKVPNIFMAHEFLITGEITDEFDTNNRRSEPFTKDQIPLSPINDDTYFEDQFDIGYFKPPDEETRTKVVQILKAHNIQLMPYKTNAELTIIVTSFLEQNEQNLIFRIYVPAERMWANEAEKLLQLFREYLQKVSKFNIRQDQYRTNQGVMYEFFGDNNVPPSTLPDKFTEFSTFLDTCIANPVKAQVLLESKNLNKTEVFNIIDRYTREARRLHIDLKQERERKLLTIKHNLESELAEYAIVEKDWSLIDKIIDNSIPRIDGFSSAISFNRDALPQTSQNLTVNINPQIIETINGVVAQEIIGDQHIGPDAKSLLDIIEQYGSDKKVELTSAVHELVDPNVKKTDRITAKQKLKGFILPLGSKIGDIGMGMIQSFIENQIGF